MQRISLALATLALLATSLTGCCCSHLCGGGYGACYQPAPACGSCGAATYGAPAMVAPGGCPSGNCGMYPSGAYYAPNAPVAASLPGTLTTAALPMNPLPTY
jgi:hypothetical protein